MDQSVAQSNGDAAIRLAEVSRRVFLIVVCEGLGLVHVCGGRRNDPRYRVVGGVKSSRIHKRLEYRTWLAKSVGCPIELALGIISPAHHRHNLACFCVHCHQGCLKRAGCEPPGFDFIERGKLFCEGGVSCPLQIEVNSGVDSEMFLGAGSSDHVAQLSLNKISKIGRIGNIDPALRRSDL